MRKTYELLDIDLQLFDGAAGGAAAGGESAGEGAAQGEAGALPKAEKGPGRSRRGKSGAFENVVFGTQGDAPQTATTSPVAGESKGEGNAKTGVEPTSDSLEAKRNAFRDLTKGEYKEEFAEEVQRIINSRFKETKSMENSLNAQKPIMDLLMQRYHIADGDMAKLQDAIENDNTYWEAEAEANGMTVEQLKAIKKLERENAALTAERQRRAEADRRMLGAQAAQQKMNEWYAQAEQVKELYPTFDFKSESANPNFLSMLKSGVSVQQAYEVIHMDEIKTNAARAAAQTAGQQMVAKIQSKAARPAENGTSSQSAVIVKNDVHSLTKKERAEAARRAERGVIQRF